MRRNLTNHLVLILAAILLLIGAAGCSGINIDDDATAQTAVVITARRVAVIFADKNPDLIVPATAFCEVIATGELTQASVDHMMAYLQVRLGDEPMLMADIKSLIELVKLKGTGEFDSGLVKAAAAGFASGLGMITAVK
jgi:hypothetical protein